MIRTRIPAKPRVAIILFGLIAMSIVAFPPSSPAASSILRSGPHFSDPPTDQEILASDILPQPLVPTGRTNADENRRLVRALTEYQQWQRPGEGSEDVSPITDFTRQHPGSRWEAALDVSLGIIYRRTGAKELCPQ